MTAYHLFKETSYLDSLKKVIKLAGDTDTNACIVGGVIGALTGKSNISEHMIEAVMKLRFPIED